MGHWKESEFRIGTDQQREVSGMSSNTNIGKAALVTASTDGIGFAVACSLFGAGYSVLLNGRDPARLREAVEKIRALGGNQSWVDGVSVDLSEAASCRTIVTFLESHETPLRAAFINTPTPSVGLPEALSENDWRYAVQSIVRFPEFALRNCAETMARHGGGAIVVNSSCSATIPIGPQFFLSNTLRSVSLAQAKAYARRYAEQHIRINVLLTGFVDTRLTRSAAENIALAEKRQVAEVWESWEHEIPLGRLARPDEIAKAALFLLSDDASYMTGTALEIDGGLSTLHYNF
jgi:3-oxoacyl-[acyl-carrier protein] reductase